MIKHTLIVTGHPGLEEASLLFEVDVFELSNILKEMAEYINSTFTGEDAFNLSFTVIPQGEST